jgi:hypothetical protein
MFISSSSDRVSAEATGRVTNRFIPQTGKWQVSREADDAPCRNHLP